MSKYIIPIESELRIEASSPQEAKKIADAYRKFVIKLIHIHNKEPMIERVSIKVIHEVLEVDASWLENMKLRTNFRREWEYAVHQVPLTVGCKLHFTHRIAIGPKPYHVDMEQAPVEAELTTPLE